MNIHNAFHAGQYSAVTTFDTSSFSSSNALSARILKLRAQLALGQHAAVLSELKITSNPDLSAVKVLAGYLQSVEKGQEGGEAVEAARTLASAQGENLTVQLCCGTVLARAGETEEALALLARHQGSLDAVALIIQIHLQQNRTDLAAKEAQRARKWAQDSLLVNLAESWVGLRQGGESYQSAFYVYEELAQAPSTQTTHSLIGQAICELHLGRLPEAESALQQALALDSNSADALANLMVLHAIQGQDTQELKSRLEKVRPGHQILVDAAAKREAFEAARAKYSPKFEV